LNRKIIIIVFLVLILSAGIIALTQELDIFTPETDYENSLDDEDENDDNSLFRVKEPARWFRSNAGGLAIEETESRLRALRNEYALAIDSAYPDELPEYLLPFYDDEYSIEVRMLYRRSEQIRTQWLFRDDNEKTRLIAVIQETESEKIIKAEEDSDEEDTIEIIVNKKGFIEIFDEGNNIVNEYRYYEGTRSDRIDNEYNEGVLISSSVLIWEENDDGGVFVKLFTDFYRYNRSHSLRNIERIFYSDMIASEEDLVRIAFPRNIRDAVNDGIFISERLNLYPEFFGDVFIKNNSKMIFETDDRGRIQKQTLYDEDDEVIWVIRNTWSNNRITTTTKTDGDIVYTAEFRYNSAGDRVSERNLKNGVLERSVRAEGNFEIEELYMNNIIVLRAVWEEGVKISETRVR